MTSQSIRFPTLAAELWPALPSGRIWLRNLTLAMVGAVLLTLAAKIKIPFYPVPLTMQTFVVLTIGVAYGARLGASTILLYLIIGAMGLPVFADTPEKGLGLAYMMGPTGGYLAGFVVAAAATGYLAEKGWDRRMVLTFAAMLVGNIIIYVPGLIWLGAVVGWEKPVFQWGLHPFVLGDLSKIVVAMLVIPATWKIVKNPH